jgi:RNA polymerase sigma-70 factor (ECF subfamily)
VDQTIALLAQFRRGHDSEAAFRALFEIHYPPVVRFFRRKGIPLEECPDLAQEVFISVYKELRQLQNDEQFRGWLFAIARNAFHHYLERHHAEKRGVALTVSAPESIEAADGRPGALEAVLDRERVRKLREAMDGLPQQMRRCVTERVVGEASYEQIAERVGISINTVKAHLHRAKAELQKRLRPYFGEIEV